MSSLFKEFDKVSAKQWKQKIQVDLKGADYNDTLITHTPEGIDIKPFYSSEDIETVTLSSSSQASQWKICETIYAKNASVTNERARAAMERGTEALRFVLPSEDISLKTLLQDIDLDDVPVHLESHFLSEIFLKKLIPFQNSGLTIGLDILGNLAKSGNWYHGLEKDHDIIQKALEDIGHKSSIFSVDVGLYQNAGANMVQQLAYGMAHVNEYLNHFGAEAVGDVEFKVSLGGNYFFEIAKLQAIRKLWFTLVSAYTDDPPRCRIHTTPSKRNKTLYEYNMNMLRTTTECMSAVLGGTDTISNLPYDTLYHKHDEFGDRIARNQLLILKHESYFDKVNNPAEGAYYLESITEQLVEKALLLFKEIEAGGGLLRQLKEGTIQRKIQESAAKEQETFDSQADVLVGTNKYPNEQDRMRDELELFPFVKRDKRKTLVVPIIPKRLAEEMEQKRSKRE